MGQRCLCQLFKTRMLTSFQNKTNSSTLWMGCNKMVLSETEPKQLCCCTQRPNSLCLSGVEAQKYKGGRVNETLRVQHPPPPALRTKRTHRKVLGQWGARGLKCSRLRHKCMREHLLSFHLTDEKTEVHRVRTRIGT